MRDSGNRRNGPPGYRVEVTTPCGGTLSPRAEWVARFKRRLLHLAAQVIEVSRTFPRSQEGRIISEQLIRSVASVAANYRAACRSRSSRELRSRLGVVVEEADETAFWLELASTVGLLPPETAEALAREAYEVVAIMATSRRTLRGRA